MFVCRFSYGGPKVDGSLASHRGADKHLKAAFESGVLKAAPTADLEGCPDIASRHIGEAPLRGSHVLGVGAKTGEPFMLGSMWIRIGI